MIRLYDYSWQRDLPKCIQNTVQAFDSFSIRARFLGRPKANFMDHIHKRFTQHTDILSLNDSGRSRHALYSKIVVEEIFSGKGKLDS